MDSERRLLFCKKVEGNALSKRKKLSQWYRLAYQGDTQQVLQ